MRRQMTISEHRQFRTQSCTGTLFDLCRNYSSDIGRTGQLRGGLRVPPYFCNVVNAASLTKVSITGWSVMLTTPVGWCLKIEVKDVLFYFGSAGVCRLCNDPTNLYTRKLQPVTDGKVKIKLSELKRTVTKLIFTNYFVRTKH